MLNYRVIDLRSGAEAEEQIDARSPILPQLLSSARTSLRGTATSASLCAAFTGKTAAAQQIWSGYIARAWASARRHGTNQARSPCA